MILKGLKEKSNKNYIDKCVKKRQVISKTNKINTVGILVNEEEFLDVSWINSLSKVLDVDQKNLKIIALTKPKSKIPSVYTNTFSVKDLGWKGNVKNKNLKAFIEEDFDLLISYYSSELLPLIFTTASSNAHFKVGINQSEENHNDLTIQTSINDTKTFSNELVKYLKILNKL